METENVTTDKIGSVLVAGAGIAGMQSALDLANAGFKVYITEEGDSIGGRMAQLDKTFPTNDCAMCTISPRLIDIDKHPNIEILTRTEVLSIDGEAGRFQVQLEKKPRYVDLDLCNACGDCIEVCPVSVANPHEYGLAPRKAIYKNYPQAIPNAYGIEKGNRSPCGITCPAGINCQGYIALVSEGKFAEAAKLIFDQNPFLSICGRVCHHPCEDECHRGDYDEAVAINPIKRFLGDWALDHPDELAQVIKAQTNEDEETGNRKAENESHRVAIIGSGPAGLCAGLDLIRLGYAVTIFESSAEPGGMLRYGFPDYRLPKDIVGREIGRILDLGIELKLNTEIGTGISIDDLKQQGFEAVFVGIGLQVGRTLNLDGGSHKSVLNGVDFLHDVNAGKPVDIGDEVIVIGGGNVAIDVAMTAVRVGGKKVKLVCLESREQMPAHSWEIEDAQADGIEILNSWGPTAVNINGSVTGLSARRCINVLDESGRFNPSYDESETTVIAADTVIFAIGQSVDRTAIENLGLELSNQATAKINPITLETNIEGVFAGGDVVKLRSSVVEAVGFGHEAAISIDRYIHGIDLQSGRDNTKEKAAKPERDVEPAERVQEGTTPTDQRQGTFAELSQSISAEDAISEAKRCLNCGICSECLQCFYACEPKAIFHDSLPKVEELDVGAVVLAPGFEPFDATGKAEYGYGRYPNVVTAPEFERILSASGPYGGEIKRPSDGKIPETIAWIQCVGSRDHACDREYCSSVCCMYATKQAIVAREHEGDHLQATIFYNDIRAFGKGFERYYDRAKNELDVSYVKCLVSSVKQYTKTNNLIIKYIDEANHVAEEEVDMVVLSVGLSPRESTKKLFGRLGLEVNSFGFHESDPLMPCKTERDGIFVCGAGEGPKDIPESVVQAGCAAALAGEVLTEARGTLVAPKIYPVEREVEDEEARVGVFVCHCGTNIARVIDVDSLTQFAEMLPNVVHAERNLYTCSTDTQSKITEIIKEKGINRVVVSSCTPRTHESLFQDTIREAGLNKYLFEMANIRDQCSWVHPDTPELALDKAKDLVAMSVERAKTLEPLKEIEFEIEKSALIVGAGAAGMTAALSVADQGFNVVIVEKNDEPGGNLRRVKSLIDGRETGEFLHGLSRKIVEHPRITLLTGARIIESTGHVGEFVTRVDVGEDEITVEHGVIIFATGAVEYTPTEYLYGANNNVLTQSELEGLMEEHPESLKAHESLVMIQCVGSREEPHNYCSRICCQEAVKNALHLKRINPELRIYILYRDIRTYGFSELFYLEARQLGVTFIRYDLENKPVVDEPSGRLRVTIEDAASGKSLTLAPDLLVTSAGIRSDETVGALLQVFKAPVNEDGFLFEAHAKLRPLDFANEGMFMAGFAHAPKLLSETLAQAKAAAARAVVVLSKDTLAIDGSVAVVDEERCAICLTCIRQCPYEIPKINEDNRAYIDVASCQGCGICAAACPAKAIDLRHYKDEQILAKCGAFQLRKELEHAGGQ